MRSGTVGVVAVMVCALLCVSMGAVSATPYFGINTYDEWMAAYGGGGGGGGAIQTVSPAQWDAMMAKSPDWPSDYRGAMFAEPELEVVQDHLGSPALIMRWKPDDPDWQGYVAAAWDYVYPMDPDLRGTKLEFSIHVPGPCMFFSVNLVNEVFDPSGQVIGEEFKEWIWHVGPDSQIPFCQWVTVTIDPETGATNWPLFAQVFESAGFDLSKVTRIRFDENGRYTDVNLRDPDPRWNQFIWNAWDHVEVSPEPGTMLLLGGGLLALARRRRRK